MQHIFILIVLVVQIGRFINFIIPMLIILFAFWLIGNVLTLQGEIQFWQFVFGVSMFPENNERYWSVWKTRFCTNYVISKLNRHFCRSDKFKPYQISDFLKLGNDDKDSVVISGTYHLRMYSIYDGRSLQSKLVFHSIFITWFARNRK